MSRARLHDFAQSARRAEPAWRQAAQRQEIGGVVHFEANRFLERGDNQANNDHIGQVVLGL